MQASSFARIRALVRERAAIVLEPGKEYLVESRLQDIVRARGFDGVDELCMHLDSDGPELAYQVVEAMTTNETSFFRDQTPFEVLRQVLMRARLGRYKQVEVNRGLSPAQVQSYFTRDGAEFQIADALRDMVTFEELNLIQSWPRVPSFDVVFLRNVLIYFDRGTKHAVLTKLRQRLAEEGFLFLGGSETLGQAEVGLERVPLPHSGCYRRPKTCP